MDMVNLTEKFDSVILTYNGGAIADDKYMRINRNIILNKISEEKPFPKGLLIVHPGTEQLMVLTLLCTAFGAVFCSGISPEDYLEQLMSENIVLYNNKRYRFLGKKDNSCVLEQDGTKNCSDITITIPIESAYKIRLYKGDATTTGSRGMRKNASESNKFLCKWVGEEHSAAAYTLPNSVLIITEKEIIVPLIEKTTLRRDNTELSFSEVFPTAWFTQSDNWINLPGNSAGAYPVVMLTNKISVARELIYDDLEQRIRSVVVNGNASMLSSPDELRHIIKKRNVHDVTLLSLPSIKSLPEYFWEEGLCETLYWSNHTLLSALDDLYKKRSQKNEKSLMQFINTQIDRETICVEVKPNFDEEKPLICRAAIKKLCRYADKHDEIKKFAIISFGLLKFYEQSCFNISEYEELIHKGDICARFPSEQLDTLKEIHLLQIFGSEIKNNMETVVMSLEEMHRCLLLQNIKAEKIIQIITENNSIKQEDIAIVVNKPSYIGAVKLLLAINKFESVSVYTPSKFTSNAIYNYVIVSGICEWKRYNPFMSNNAVKNLILAYPSEKAKYLNNLQDAEVIVSFHEKHNILHKLIDYENNQTVTSNAKEKLVNEEDLEKMIETFIVDSAVNICKPSDSNTSMLHAVRWVVFEDDKWAVLTKYYSPYILDDLTGKLVDGNVLSLSEGDVLLFAGSDREIGDFVDAIMQDILKSTPDEFKVAYEKSIRWKNVLKNFMRQNNFTYSSVAKIMKKMGHPRHSVTIRGWLNEDSRIIGPWDEDSFIAIALVTGDEDMLESAESYKDACSNVRKMRKRILDFVQEQLIHSSTVRVPSNDDKDFGHIIGDASRFVTKHRIASIIPIDIDVPAGLANRPQEGEEV